MEGVSSGKHNLTSSVSIQRHISDTYLVEDSAVVSVPERSTHQDRLKHHSNGCTEQAVREPH